MLERAISGFNVVYTIVHGYQVTRHWGKGMYFMMGLINGDEFSVFSRCPEAEKLGF